MAADVARGLVAPILIALEVVAVSGLDDALRSVLFPITERIQTLERDAASMQKLVGELALQEPEKVEVVALNAEQTRVIVQALDFAISKSGPEVNCRPYRILLDWLRREL